MSGAKPVGRLLAGVPSGKDGASVRWIEIAALWRSKSGRGLTGEITSTPVRWVHDTVPWRIMVVLDQPEPEPKGIEDEIPF